jgi:Ser/Thr protein kinase RdoA (MazF antagonist)
MGLRMTMRVWENAKPWEAARRFCRGYVRWGTLTTLEVLALPQLIRLRGAITVLWWLGRMAATGTVGPIPSRIEYLRNTARWLDRHEQRLIEVILREVAP